MNRTKASTAARPARVARASPRSGTGGTLLGIFIGLLLGLALAAGVVFYVTGGWRHYQAQLAGTKESRDVREPSKVAKADTDKPRFDFYKILPGNEEPKVQAERKPPEKAPDRALAEKAAERTAGKSGDTAAKTQEKAATDRAGERVATAAPAGKAAPSGDRFWLQAGSFAAGPDAENLKARLALAGWEASVQQGVLPDKSVRYRVRLGPYDNADELNRIKSELGRRGFDVAVIKY